MGGRREVLRCTRDSLGIASIDFGVEWRHRNFAVRDIKDFRFGQVGSTRYGPINGLTFEANDKRGEFFGGLRVAEAQTILSEMQRLGVNVVADPAMPAMVKQEEEMWRKSPFG